MYVDVRNYTIIIINIIVRILCTIILSRMLINIGEVYLIMDKHAKMIMR